jgi:hypothetical protein
MFSMAIAIPTQGLNVASWDTRPKVAKQIKKYDGEIANLEAILATAELCADRLPPTMANLWAAERRIL